MIEATSWEKMEHEQLNPKIARRMVSGADGTLGQILLARGAVVPRHSHRSEQYTMVTAGAMKIIFDDGEVVLRPGDVLVIPANVPHSAVALEDTVDIDFFAPRREDWVRKDDSYLRRDEKGK
ncbi:MAG: cupin domain-containing protein [Candidatus Acidiferrales bacterium]